MGDDGIGLAALERLRSRHFDPYVELLDGGTWGMNLLPFIEAAERLLLLDAIDTGAPVDGVVRLEGDQVPRLLVTKLSPHQIDLREVLALADLRGTLPDALVALGLHPWSVEMRAGLSPRAEAGLGGLVEAAVAQLRAWGHREAEPPARARETLGHGNAPVTAGPASDGG
jgi:hydrogenase maturation protease